MNDKTGSLDRQIVVSGDDAETFLQGQLTADVRLFGDTPALAAWCNPKGRVIVVLHCRRTNGRFELRMPADVADAVSTRLAMFRFRSKVDLALEDAPDADCDALVEGGIPRIGNAQTEAYTPHMLNLDLLAAVSFDKGCYTGQEVVARTHYRGATKRRMLKFSGAGALPGDRILLGDQAIGDVVNAGTDALLAVVPLEHAEADLTVNGDPLQREPLPYLAD